MAAEAVFDIRSLGSMTFRGRENRLHEAGQPGIEGALAAMETFYYAFNKRSLDLARQSWLDHALAQLNNPIGGIMRGTEQIDDLYARLFEGPVSVWVELSDVTAYITETMVVFAGREHGRYTRDGKTYPLDIRTSRIFLYAPDAGGWRQIHHHGSIDNAEKLLHYQQTVLGS